jgi:FkbM family methyltransferase
MARPFKRLRHRLRLALGRHRHHERSLVKLLANEGIDLVIDVGAHRGAYAELLNDLGYRGEVVLVEPLSWAHAALTAKAARHPRWRVEPRCVLGATPGEAVLKVAGNGVSSSVLSAVPGQDAGDLAQVQEERVPQRTLDALLAGVDLNRRRALVKLDVQGFEAAVLDGGARVLPQVRALQLELSVQSLYRGQADWLVLLNRLTTDGWHLWQIPELSTDRASGALQQFDVILVRGPGTSTAVS